MERLRKMFVDDFTDCVSSWRADIYPSVLKKSFFVCESWSLARNCIMCSPELFSWRNFKSPARSLCCVWMCRGHTGYIHILYRFLYYILPFFKLDMQYLLPLHSVWLLSLPLFITLTHLTECHLCETHAHCCMVAVSCSSAQREELYKHLSQT